MNHGQESPSPVIRALTNESVLAGYRFIVVLGIAIVGFFLVRLVTKIDETAQTMDAFRASIQLQVSDFKIEVARSTANSNATISAIQDRVSAQSRRMDGFDVDIREVNKKLYERRGGPP